MQIGFYPVIAAVALSLTATSALATTLTGGYSVNEAYSPAQGGPSISYGLSNTNFSVNLTPGTESAPTDFLTLSPAGTCHGGGCSGVTETDTLTVNFTNLHVLGITVPTLTTTAVFTAKYSGSELSCAVGDGVSPSFGATDCVVWSGAANSWNGLATLTSDLGNGYALEIFLYNATDWNITPKIGFELVATAVPEPASAGLMVGALAALGLIRRRRRSAC